MNDKIKRIDEFKNTNEFKTIQDLLDKYMDGATSNEEEATLRKYFEEHGNDIPEEWESYRALFSYIGFEQMNLSQILKEEEKEIEGYTADEIMQITGCTADNLRKNLSRARLKIRETYMNIVKQNRTK